MHVAQRHPDRLQVIRQIQDTRQVRIRMSVVEGPWMMAEDLLRAIICHPTIGAMVSRRHD